MLDQKNSPPGSQPESEAVCVRCRWFPACWLVAIALCCTPPAAGIEITLEYDPDAPGAEDPVFDAGGVQLTAVMEAAAAHWESIILDNHNLTIRYRYQDLSGGTLAQSNYISASYDRVNLGWINFDTQSSYGTRDWWFDPTPSSNAEFAMQLHSYSGTPNSSQDFTGTPFGGFEVGYRGNAVTGGALGDYDAYSTALHEMGHLLGLLGLSGTQQEVADGDYDFPTALMNGESVAVLTAGPPPFGDINDYAHIHPGTALLCDACGSKGVRRLPSAVDIFAAAAASGWEQIDLPRKLFVQNGDFNAAANWLAGQAPGPADDAAIAGTIAGFGANDYVTLSANHNVGSLTVLEHGFSTAGHTLTAQGAVAVDGNDTTILVPAGGQLTTGNLFATGGGSIELDGGAVHATGRIHLGGTSSLAGRGAVQVDGHWDHFGGIEAVGGTLTLTAAGTGARLNFMDGSTTTLADNLVLGGHAEFRSGAAVTGPGTLIFAEGAEVGRDADLDVNVLNAGELAPGSSAGLFSIDGDYEQASTGTLSIELGGLAPSEHDRLVATGTMDLAGTLSVDLFGGHSPQGGYSYDILDFGGVNHYFETYLFEELPTGLLWDISQLYTAGVLSVVASVPGDYNHDGTVGLEDYIKWRDAFGQIGMGMAADGNLDNVVDTGDLELWRLHFGETSAAAGNTAGNAASTSVPEPAAFSLWLLALAVGQFLTRARRRVARGETPG